MPMRLGLALVLLVDQDLDLALADQRMVELADLIALRQIGVEVVLAVEARPGVDLRVERHAGAHRLADALAVRHRQHAGHRRVDQADLRVRLGAERGRRAGEQLGAVAVICAWTSRPITTSHSPVSPLMRKGRESPASSASFDHHFFRPAAAVKASAASPLSIARPAFEHAPARRARCRSAAGRAAGPCPSSPPGTLIAGRPARLAGTANTSFRYIASGSVSSRRCRRRRTARSG